MTDTAPKMRPRYRSKRTYMVTRYTVNTVLLMTLMTTAFIVFHLTS